jgi:branched-chain amino acid transport system permease protein
VNADIAAILAMDGLANGAVYLLAGLGLVLVFSVTRVVFVPFGDVAAFAALSLQRSRPGARRRHSPSSRRSPRSPSPPRSRA